MEPSTVAVSDVLVPTEADYPAGRYRVVGATEERVTLLVVGDAEGLRIHSGELLRVSRGDLTGFEATGPPIVRRTLGGRIAAALAMLYWSLRAFARQTARHPRATGAAVALLAAGFLADVGIPGSENQAAAVVLLGALALAYVGSGRL